MFRKLKEKITEEVKSSPQRLQQFTQSVSDKLQQQNSNAAATTTAAITAQSDDNNLFSIDDDSNNGDGGFSNISLSSPSDAAVSTAAAMQRRNSNSSMASDVSFLPRYESMANLYHLQSDFDASASEMEDNVSISSSSSSHQQQQQLEHLSKSEIYAAFQKAQSRYHKYRGRYSDLAKHYADMERENGKIRLVLVDTQDKAIRRVTELREQCGLEQRAKAHLESVLRDELDEKQLKLDSLQMKIGLLLQQQNGGDGDALMAPPLINNDSSVVSTTTGTTNTSDTNNLDVLTRYLNDARAEIENLNEKLQEMKANTIIYQSKEQDNRMKLTDLQKEINVLLERERETNFKMAENKMELHNELLNKDTEISRLKSDLETLKQHDNLIKPNDTNLQIQNKKLIDRIEQLTEKYSTYDSDLVRLEQYRIEIEQLKEEKAEEIERVRDEARASLSSLEVKLREQLTREQLVLLTANDTTIETINAQKRELASSLEQIHTKYRQLDENYTELMNESNELRQNNWSFSEKILRLETDLTVANGELVRLNQLYCDTQSEKVCIENQMLDLVRVNEEKMAAKKDEIDLLKVTNNELLAELTQTKQTVSKQQQELIEIVNDKNVMEKKMADLIEQVRLGDERMSAIDLDNTETKLLEMKLHELELKHNELLRQIDGEQQIDTNELIELREINAKLVDELKQAKQSLDVEQNELIEIENEKMATENKMADLQLKVRLSEERDETVDLGNTEAKLVEMKLQQLELKHNELLQQVASEQQIDTKELIELREINAKLLDELKQAKQSLTDEQNELIEIENEKITMEKKMADLQLKVRLSEERDEAVDLDNTEAKLLEMKLQQLELKYNELLRQIDSEEQIDSKELIELREINAKLVDELKQAKQSLGNEQNELIEIENEKIAMENKMAGLQMKVRLSEERDEAIDLDNTEAKLLEMKLQQLECKYNELLRLVDGEQQIDENELHALRETNEKLVMELEQAKQSLSHQQIELIEIENEKVVAENKMAGLQMKVRLSEEKDEAVDLDNTETKLLEMKLQKMEQDETVMLQEFENERQTFERLLSDNSELKTKNQRIHDYEIVINDLKTKLSTIELSLKREQCEKNELQESNWKMEYAIRDLEQKVRLSEELGEAIDLDNTETKLLEMKLHQMEVDRANLLQEFEMERELFNKLLKDNTHLKDAQDKVQKLEENLELMNNIVQSANEKMQMQALEMQSLHDENLRLELSQKDRIELLETSHEQEQRTYDEMMKTNNVLQENIVLIKHELAQSDELVAQLRTNHSTELNELKVRLENDVKQLQDTVDELRIGNERLQENVTLLQVTNDDLIKENRNLHVKLDELEQLKEKQANFESIVQQLNVISNEKQLLLKEVSELKTVPPPVLPTDELSQKLEGGTTVVDGGGTHKYVKEIESLREKLMQYKSLDLTNRSSIEFYVNELEKLKVKNQKLNQQLDETLVTLNHCTELTSSTTEIEYLRNVLYNYMLGKESLVLARVIAAVCKFDPEQTDTILQKEQQKQTLLGQLGIL